jgi:4-alpha-glucanotransferase
MELLTRTELDDVPVFSDAAIDFGKVIAEKEKLFMKAFARFNDTKEFIDFCEREHYWLNEYALFTVIKARHGGKSWVEWDAGTKLRFPSALDAVLDTDRRAVRYEKFLQFIFHGQWMSLRAYAKQAGVRIIGDMPIYVAYDSSDAWASPELFELDENGGLLRVAGVPPDYFSATGQLWGNPLYQWKNMRLDGYAWWIKRIRKTLELVDYLRLDHFRGFESYWAVPAGSATAVDGTWEQGPGEDFFNAVRNALGAVPIIAEDLGEITHGVEELRRKVGLPGMKVLQFAFSGDSSNPYLPYNVNTDSIMYTGTHDNNTSCGWYADLDEKEHSFVTGYLGCADNDFINRFLRCAYASPSRLCIVPAQDVLGLDAGNRMNTPGKESGNWQWRMKPEFLDSAFFERARDLTIIYGREADEGFML